MIRFLRVARDYSRPPVTVLTGRPERWRTEDSLLAAAYDKYLQERVGPSGYPLRLATLEDPWELDDDLVDQVQALHEEWSAEKHPPGSVPRVSYHPTIRPEDR